MIMVITLFNKINPVFTLILLSIVLVTSHMNVVFYIWIIKHAINSFQVTININFSAACDISQVVATLYAPGKPLTSLVLARLRGCLVLLFFRSPRCGSTSVYFLLNELSKKLTFQSMLGNPMKGKVNHTNWVCATMCMVDYVVVCK